MPRELLKFEQEPAKGIATEKHYSVKEIAETWGVSENTVRRSFQDIPGVLKISQRRLTARGHKRVTLRIPASIMEKFHHDWSAGFRGAR